LSNLRRISNIILDNLEEGTKNKLMDQKELRLMGSVAIRSVRLFLKSLEEENARRTAKAQKEAAGSTKTGQEDQNRAGND
jgi:hypothetical protein